MDKALLKRTAAAFEALDFSAEAAQVDDLEAHIAEWQAAIDKAETRRTEITRAISERRGPDGRAIADALVAGVDVLDATRIGPTVEEMQAERESLVAAIRDLRHRIEDTRPEINRIKDKCLQTAAKLAQPLVDDVMVELRGAAEKLVEGYVVLSAINWAVRGYSVQEGAASRAVEGVTGMHGLLVRRREIEVPDMLREVLSILLQKDVSLPAKVLPTISTP